MASIIIPIRANKIYDRSIRRLYRLLNTIPSFYELVVVDDGSSKYPKQIIERITKNRNNTKYFYINSKNSIFSLSRARNKGAEISSTGVIIFHDLDFITTKHNYIKINNIIQQENLSQNPENYFCVPVIFTTENGTKEFLATKNISCSFYESDKNKRLVIHIAYGSSCIVCNREHFLKIGGFDLRFKGHGAEDFALLHKLGKEFPKAPFPVNYTLNTGSGHIKEYEGFRAYFATFAKACVDSDIYLIHLYHPKRKQFGYYRHKRNFRLLKNLMESDE